MVNTWPVVRREAEYATIYSALVEQAGGLRHRRDRRRRRRQDDAGAVGDPVAALPGAVGGGNRVGAQHPAGRVRPSGRVGDVPRPHRGLSRPPAKPFSPRAGQ